MIELDIPDHYKGREPAFIKHYFLRQYVEKLAFKIGSRFDDLVYVDGFSGPWKSGAENYDDTSFGIALQCLTKARSTWRGIKPHYRDVRMTAHLVEKNKDAFRELEGIGPRFPEVSVFPHHGNFIELAPAIAARIPPRAFTFALIDPKGFSLDLEALRPLLKQPRTEVVFNFMYDFANRWIDVPELSDTYDRLLPGIDWRSRLAEASDAGPAARKAAFLACFKDAVRDVFGFRYVADVDIRHGSKDRTLYFLVYGTREPAGIEVFRDCQVKALETQAHATGQRTIDRRTEAGIGSLFGAEWEASSVNHRQFLDEQKRKAGEAMLNMARAQSGIHWKSVWPDLLSDYVVRKTDLGAIANKLRSDGLIAFPQWQGKKRTPDDDFTLISIANSTVDC